MIFNEVFNFLKKLEFDATKNVEKKIFDFCSKSFLFFVKSDSKMRQTFLATGVGREVGPKKKIMVQFGLH